MRYPTIILILLILCSIPAIADAQPLAITSADKHGDVVVFSLGEDLWIISKPGAEAVQLTNGPAMDSQPLFSPDGKSIAFQRRVNQNTDVYSMNLETREITRHSWHPDGDSPVTWADNDTILYITSRGGFFFSELMSVAITEPGEKRMPVQRAADASVSADGSFLAIDRYEKNYLRHRNYSGGSMGEIRIFETGSYQQTGEVRSEDANYYEAAFIGSQLYCLSDLDGTMNLYRVAEDETIQLTNFQKWDIRAMESAGDELILVQNGQLFAYDTKSDELRAIEINMPPVPESLVETVPMRSRPGSLAVSPDHQRLALEYMGEVVLVSGDGSMEQLTNTPGVADRSVVWSPDGTALAWLSQGKQGYELLVHSFADSSERRIGLSEEDEYYFQPVWSPDGSWIALAGRNLHLWLVNLETGEVRKIATSHKANQDNFNVAWSADGAHMAFMLFGENGLGAVHIYTPAEDRLVQVTPGIRHSHSPVFSADGSALYYLRDHARVGPFLDFALSVALHFEHNLSTIMSLPIDEALAGGLTGTALPFPESRIMRLMPGAENSLLIHSRTEQKGLSNSSSNDILYKLALDSMELEAVKENASFCQKEHNGALVASGPMVEVYNPATGEISVFDLRRIAVETDQRQIWKQVMGEFFDIHRNWFYDPDLHGQDWEMIEEHFSRYLPGLRSRYELNDVLTEAMSHLSATHMGVGGGIPGTGQREDIGTLGADFELADGACRISRIYTGDPLVHDDRSPLAVPGVNVAAGDYLLAVNGETVDVSRSPYVALTGTAGKDTELTIASSPSGSDARTVSVKPLAFDDFIRWMSWVAERRQRVAELSDGRLAYIYIPDFRPRGLESFIQQFYAQRYAEGIVIDIRLSRGGVSGDAMIDYLRRTQAFRYIFRAGDDQPFPQGSYSGPMVLLAHELNTSSSDTFPLMFKEAGLGPIVGRTTYGAAIGGYYDVPRFIDGGAMASVNRAILNEMNGEWLEYKGVEPDIEVRWPHSDWLAGSDPQLERAVAEALKLIEQAEKPKPVPAYPDYK